MKKSNKKNPVIERGLTKAEEQVMQAVWQRDHSYLKDVVEAMPAPQPHSNTVATILKILIDKGFVQAEAVGRNNLYSALVSKEEYSRATMGNLVSNYFNGSFSNAVSFLVDQKQLSVADLEMLLQELKKK
ncbi:BlaI/MecI/CopY family transcriptional regulator [Aridibaculum aurantiacum]|uniref:BlaI/MecI/CopY family transcriptional regulator n=1 Tax=Aridibaculum aurantiacum TaxID=2810307 RepID=UPI001A958D97|nr:BlaI/MecI/CopY family transcriptional regulator [Aridibaculum aurantiacum]